MLDRTTLNCSLQSKIPIYYIPFNLLHSPSALTLPPLLTLSRSAANFGTGVSSHPKVQSHSFPSHAPSDPLSSLSLGPQSSAAPVGLRNRWVDKPVQFIIFDNAQAGIMGEHSVMDGTPTARMCDDILENLHDPSFDHGVSLSASSSQLPVPLDWQISAKTEAAIVAADRAAVALAEGQTLGFHLTTYGKAAIKQFGVSPDSWAQMIVQLAYGRLLAARGERRAGGTYEAATTRRFYKGRTEAIRVVSAESDRWVASMDDPKVGKSERKWLFEQAGKKHLALAKQSGLGLGVDRVMFG